jgi:hypothetical protein
MTFIICRGLLPVGLPASGCPQAGWSGKPVKGGGHPQNLVHHQMTQPCLLNAALIVRRQPCGYPVWITCPQNPGENGCQVSGWSAFQPTKSGHWPKFFVSPEGVRESTGIVGGRVGSPCRAWGNGCQAADLTSKNFWSGSRKSWIYGQSRVLPHQTNSCIIWSRLVQETRLMVRPGHMINRENEFPLP